jgi:hypothetical protein
MGLKAGLDVLVKRKNFCPYHESNPSHPVHSSVTILTELPWLQKDEESENFRMLHNEELWNLYT